MRMNGGVEIKAEEVLELGGSRLYLESVLKSIDRAVELLMVPEPGSEFGVDIGIGVGKLSFKRFRRSAGMNGRNDGQGGR